MYREKKAILVYNMCDCVWRWKSSLVAGCLRADSHYTSCFHSITDRHRSVKFSHVYLNVDVHADRNISIKSQFRSVRRARMFDGTERVRTSLNQLDSDNVNSPMPCPVRFECLLAAITAWFFFGNGWKINRIGV